MKVTLLAHTQLSREVFERVIENSLTVRERYAYDESFSDGQVVALAAIRQCYSHKTALEVLETESERYFGNKGVEGKRLFNHIVKSGHTSTLEHISFTFAIEGVSRSLLAQLTRHRHMSFSVQSQRYNKLSSDSRSGGFGYVKPSIMDWGNPAFQTYEDAKKIKAHNLAVDASIAFEELMENIQDVYDALIKMGIPQEDARSVLPNAATCNLVMSANFRTLLDFYSKRKPGKGAQHEIATLAEEIKNRVIEVEPWTEEYFNL